MNIRLMALVLLAAFATHSAAAGEAEDAALVASTRATLELLIGMDTTNPPGNERALVNAVQKLLAEDGIEADVLGPEGPRASLLARLPATKKSKLGPLMIVAHIDTVGFGAAWSSDALTLTEREGYLYGRGVIDNKGMAAASIELLRFLSREKQKRRRDILLLLAADEDRGPSTLLVSVLPGVRPPPSSTRRLAT